MQDNYYSDVLLCTQRHEKLHSVPYYKFICPTFFHISRV